MLINMAATAGIISVISLPEASATVLLQRKAHRLCLEKCSTLPH
jgi:hypothetical protein